MIEIIRRVGPVLFRIQTGIQDRADQIAVFRGGQWMPRPIHPQAMTEENGARHRHGVTVDDAFFPLVEINHSPEAADPLAQ